MAICRLHMLLCSMTCCAFIFTYSALRMFLLQSAFIPYFIWIHIFAVTLNSDVNIQPWLPLLQLPKPSTHLQHAAERMGDFAESLILTLTTHRGIPTHLGNLIVPLKTCHRRLWNPSEDAISPILAQLS